MSSNLIPANLDPKKDKRLINTALKNNWPITNAIRELLVKKAVENVQTKDVTIRDCNASINTIIKMDALNLKQQELKIKAQPKVLLVAKMTTAELEDYVKGLMTEMELLPEDQPKLIDAMIAQQGQPDRKPVLDG